MSLHLLVQGFKMISSPSDSSDEAANGPSGESGKEPDEGSAASGSARTSFTVRVTDHNENEVKETELPAQDHGEGRPMVPTRVQEALDAAGSFSDFKDKRIFNVLRLFSGKRDVLGEAVKRLAEVEGMKVDVYSIDTEINEVFDLAQDLPYHDILDDARGGKFDMAHAGPPCGSFSRVRWRPGGPPPVRSLRFIYGLPTNSVRQQAEADKGTRSTPVVGEVIQSQRLRKVPEAGTLENPPGSDDADEGPGWTLPEVMIFLKKFECQEVEFNTCAYQMKLKDRWFKPAKFAGKLDGLKGLKRRCTCPTGFKHEALIGKEKTSKAAEYPEELALEYGKLVIKVFRAVLNLEWWRNQERKKKGELTEAQKRWVMAKEKTSVPAALDDDSMRSMRSFHRSHDIESVQDSRLPGQAQVSKKRRREDENEFYIGGMRNPAVALSQTQYVEGLGKVFQRPRETHCHLGRTGCTFGHGCRNPEERQHLSTGRGRQGEAGSTTRLGTADGSQELHLNAGE